MKRAAKLYKQSPFARFLGVGAANWVLTYACYLGVWYLVHDYRWAFWISLAVGITFATVTNIHHTFLRRLNPVASAFYIAYYFTYSMVNFLCLAFVIERLGAPEEIAPLITMIVLTPINYVLSRKLIEHLSHPRT